MNITRQTIPARTVLDAVRDILDVDGAVMVTVQGPHEVLVQLSTSLVTAARRCVVCGDLGCEYCPAVRAGA